MKGLLVAALSLVAASAGAQDGGTWVHEDRVPEPMARPTPRDGDPEHVGVRFSDLRTPTPELPRGFAGDHLAGEALTPPAWHDLPGTFGDPFRALMLAPGVTPLASGVPLPVIRGMQPSATHLFVDGVRIPWGFHFAVGPSVIAPDLIDRLWIHPGLAPAKYGRHVGGTVEVELDTSPSPRGLSDAPVKLEGVTTLDLLNAGGIARYRPSGWTNVALSVRAGYSALVGSAVASGGGAQTSAGMFDYLGHVEHRIAPGTGLRLLVIGGAEGGGRRGEPGEDVIGARLGFHRADLRLRTTVGEHSFEAGATAGLDRLGIEAGGGGVLGGDVREQLLAARVSGAFGLASSLSLEVGADLERRDAVIYQTTDFALTDGTPVDAVVRQPLGTALFAGVYAQLHAHDLAGWNLELASRFDTLGVQEHRRRYVVDPHVRATRSFGAVDVHGGAGFFHQTATSLLTLPALDVVRARLPLQEVAKVEAGARWALDARTQVGGNLFAHPYMRMLELSPLDSDFQAQITRAPEDIDPFLAARHWPGAGYGVELMARREADLASARWFDHVALSVAYTFQQSWRQVTFDRRDLTGAFTGQRDTAWLSSPLEVVHSGNVVVGYRTAGGFKAGVTLFVRSGLPEAGGVASYTQREGTSSDGRPRWVPVDADAVGRMPWYWRLDARVSQEWNFRVWALEAYLDVLNVAFNQETLRYTYSEFAETAEDRLAGNIELRRGELRLPVLLPMIGVTARF